MQGKHVSYLEGEIDFLFLCCFTCYFTLIKIKVNLFLAENRGALATLPKLRQQKQHYCWGKVFLVGYYNFLIYVLKK